MCYQQTVYFKYGNLSRILLLLHKKWDCYTLQKLVDDNIAKTYNYAVLLHILQCNNSFRPHCNKVMLNRSTFNVMEFVTKIVMTLHSTFPHYYLFRSIISGKRLLNSIKNNVVWFYVLTFCKVFNEVIN